jgi:hypothetical protein
LKILNYMTDFNTKYYAILIHFDFESILDITGYLIIERRRKNDGSKQLI